MKKLIKPAIIFLASFLVINVGMFFYLKFTQPKIGPRTDNKAVAHSLYAKTDSTAVGEAKTKSAAVETARPTETAAVNSDTVHAAEKTAPAASKPPRESAPETAAASEAKPDSNAENAAEASTSDGMREIAKLSKLLESMKPEDAAGIASALTVDQIVDLVMRMKDRTAGKMLAAMPSDQSAKVALRMSALATRTRGKP